MKVVPPTIFNSQSISAEWPVNFEKNAFEILHSPYILLSWFSCQPDLSLIGNIQVFHAEDPGSGLTHPTRFFLKNYYYLFN